MWSAKSWKHPNIPSLKYKRNYHINIFPEAHKTMVQNNLLGHCSWNVIIDKISNFIVSKKVFVIFFTKENLTLIRAFTKYNVQYNVYTSISLLT